MNAKQAKKLRKKSIGHEETSYDEGRFTILNSQCKRFHYQELKRNYKNVHR